MIGKAEYVFLHEFLGIDRLKADRWGHVNSLHESKCILVVIIVMTIKKKKNTNKNIENIDSLQPLNEDDK